MQKGSLGRRRQFLTVASDALLLSSFRKVGKDSYEARVVEQDGSSGRGELRFTLPLSEFAPCNLLGKVKTPVQPVRGESIPLTLEPWEIRTLRIQAMPADPTLRQTK